MYKYIYSLREKVEISKIDKKKKWKYESKRKWKFDMKKLNFRNVKVEIFTKKKWKFQNEKVKVFKLEKVEIQKVEICDYQRIFIVRLSFETHDMGRGEFYFSHVFLFFESMYLRKKSVIIHFVIISLEKMLKVNKRKTTKNNEEFLTQNVTFGIIIQ